MFKIRALFFALAISVIFVAITSIAKAESIIYPKFSLSYEVVNINNIPSSLRTFSADEGAYLKLPDSAVGGYCRFSFGAGIKLEKKIHLEYDLSFFDSNADENRVTWLKMGIPFDEAYRYQGVDSDFSATILLFGFSSSKLENWEYESVNDGIYLKGGIRFNNSNLSSELTKEDGSHTLHSMNIYGKSYSAGIGFSDTAANGVFAIEILYSDTIDKSPRIQTYSIGIRASEMKFYK